MPQPKSGTVSRMYWQHAILCVICISMQLLEARSIHVDGTLVPGFSGVNVIIAVLEKIDKSNVFESSEWFRRDRDNTKSFLRRMAYVESKDGRQKRKGGIWNISEDELINTQMYANSSSTIDGQRHTLRQRILNSPLLGFDWMAIRFNTTAAERDNLSVPLYSGLATMIRLDQALTNNFGGVGERLRDQIQLWKTHFNGADNGDNRWFNAETHLTNRKNEDCAIKTDVVFVIDGSNSVSESDLTQAKDMIFHFTNMTMSNELERGYNRIGIVLIRSTAVIYHPLNESLSKTDLLNKITDLQYQPFEYTNTADGLCKMKQQAWRRNQNVLHLAIVLSDGRSNYISEDQACRGDTEDVANLIHTENKHILVMAIGIGHRIDFDELSMIASGRHLVVELDGYNQTAGVPASLRYQICYTLSEPIDEEEENRTVLMERDQIMRWIRKGVGGEGVTVRLCVRRGRVTLYVSSIPNPSDAVHDYQTTITPEKNIAIACSTYFKHSRPIRGRTRRNQVSEDDTETVYISIIGQDNSSLVTLQTANGNVIFDTNECEQEPYPCDESAVCYNTDGSFYCECKEGFSGDGFECTGNGFIHNQLHIMLPSCVLGVIILLSLIVLLISIISWRKCKKRKSLSIRLTQPQFHLSEIKLVKENLKKVNNNLSATNVIFDK